MNQYLIEAVGRVRNNLETVSLAFRDRDLELDEELLFEQRKADAVSELVIEERYGEYLQGIEDFSHIMVLYWSHGTPDEGRQVTKVHPGGKKEFPLVGDWEEGLPM